MEKSFAVIALLVSALCFSSALARKTPPEGFIVKGKIFCERCRFEIESRFSNPLPGVNISLQCANKNGTVTYTRQGVSGKNGMYSIPVHGDHEGEICEVVAKIPTKGLCKDALSDKSGKIALSKKKGVHHSWTRVVTPLGFMTKTIDPECDLAADELALDNLYG